jgi:hypothetical protein
VKRRLRQASLAEMKVTLAGKESFAQYTLGAHERAALDEVLLIRDEHVANQIGMVEQVDPLVAHPEEDDVSVFLR